MIQLQVTINGDTLDVRELEALRVELRKMVLPMVYDAAAYIGIDRKVLTVDGDIKIVDKISNREKL